jgi:hypothetical protein
MWWLKCGGLALILFETRKLLALSFQRPRHFTRFGIGDHCLEAGEFLPDRRDAPAAKELVELLLRVSLPIGRDLDEFKRHLPEIFPKIFQGLRP